MGFSQLTALTRARTLTVITGLIRRFFVKQLTNLSIIRKPYHVKDQG